MLSVCLMVFAGVSSFYLPTPFFVVTPGPLLNVADVITLDDRLAPANDHDDVAWYLASIAARPAKLAQAIAGVWQPHARLLPKERLMPPHFSEQAFIALNERLMRESQLQATVAAFRAAGRPAALQGEGVEILAVWPGPADAARLQAGDVIVAVDDVSVPHVPALLSVLAEARAAESEVVLLLERGGRTLTRSISTRQPAVDVPGADPLTAMGLIVATRALHADVDPLPQFDPQAIGGPSAGLAFGLYLLDRLQPLAPPLGKPLQVVATGVLYADGSVAPVGGVTEKAKAAAAMAADALIVPAANLAEAKAAAPGMTVFGVATLEQAYGALAALTQKFDHRYNGLIAGGESHAH